jgi:hypothetical protein
MDIRTVLETLQEVDLSEYKPSMSVSLSIDEAARIAEEQLIEIEFRAELDAFTKRKQALICQKTITFYEINVLDHCRTRYKQEQTFIQS